MRERITIQVIAQTADGQGGYSDAWSTFATLWAKIEQVSGKEAYQAMQIESPAVYKMTIRYIAGVTTKHRVLFGTRTFNINRVNNINEADEYIELYATEGTAT
jgi:SPP1 family predicted phage head-tail adaptor